MGQLLLLKLHAGGHAGCGKEEQRSGAVGQHDTGKAHARRSPGGAAAALARGATGRAGAAIAPPRRVLRASQPRGAPAPSRWLVRSAVGRNTSARAASCGFMKLQHPLVGLMGCSSSKTQVLEQPRAPSSGAHHDGTWHLLALCFHMAFKNTTWHCACSQAGHTSQMKPISSRRQTFPGGAIADQPLLDCPALPPRWRPSFCRCLPAPTASAKVGLPLQLQLHPPAVRPLQPKLLVHVPPLHQVAQQHLRSGRRVGEWQAGARWIAQLRPGQLHSAGMTQHRVRARGKRKFCECSMQGVGGTASTVCMSRDCPACTCTVPIASPPNRPADCSSMTTAGRVADGACHFERDKVLQTGNGGCI